MIRTHALTRTFKSVTAVDGLDLEVRQGELVALLGPNGAGKSTTLRMLTTLLAPTSGTAEVAGYDVVKQAREVRRRIGYIGQGNGAGHSQRGRDELLSQGRAYGLDRAATKARADELVASLGLESVVDQVVSSLSGGQRRRLDIAMGLIHTPPVLFLDEPSTGLDPQNRVNLQEHIRRRRDEHGTTMVLTTHYLDEADQLAERIVVIDHGRVIADDTPARLKSEHVGDRIVLRMDTPEAAGRAATRIESLAENAQIARIDSTVTARVRDGATLVPKLLRALDEAGAAVASVEVNRPSLDDVFLGLTGRSLREGVAA